MKGVINGGETMNGVMAGVKHEPYRGSSKSFLEGMGMGEVRYAESFRQALAVGFVARSYGWRVSRRKVEEGYEIRRIEEEAYKKGKLGNRVMERLEGGTKRARELGEELGLKKNTVAAVLWRLMEQGKVRRESCREGNVTYFQYYLL